VVGLLPAAGRGVRFGSSGYAKELFPLLFEADDDRALAPRPIGELALRAIRAAGADRCVVVVSVEKAEVMRVLGDGSAVELPLAYVVQHEPRGLPHAIRCARPWLGDADVLFAMPDTVFLPTDALARVHSQRVEQRADLALGVFPVDEPERLGPVELAKDGRVLAVHDKPRGRAPRNSWGVASWSARFTELCCAWDRAEEARGNGERALGHAFEAARKSGLAMTGRAFDDGAFLDIGTPKGLRAALSALATRGVLVPDQSLAARRRT
jgi:glucose-1-phosphate thymidylyltransferase